MQNEEKSFLGTGWSFPPTFSRINNSVKMVSDGQDIQESVWVLLSTSLGERVMVPGYGAMIWSAVFQTVTFSLITQLKDFIRTAILTWESRIDVDEISIEPDASVDGVLLIEVQYTIRQTNTRSNLVFPFHIQEGTIPPEIT